MHRRRYRGFGRDGFGEIQDLEHDEQSSKFVNPAEGVVSTYLNRDKTILYPFVAQIASLQVMPNNPARCYLLIQNQSASAIFLNFGADATAVNGLQINPGGFYEQVGSGVTVSPDGETMGQGGGSFVSPDSINVIGAAANLRMIAVEGSRPAF